MARTKQTTKATKQKRPIFEPDDSVTEMEISAALAEASNAQAAEASTTAASSDNTPNTKDPRKMGEDEAEPSVSNDEGSQVDEVVEVTEAEMAEVEAEASEDDGAYDPSKVKILPS